MAVEAAASAIGGATPFGWASLGLSLLGGAAKAAPAGPSSADALFGSVPFYVDSSGWVVNTGDGATTSQENSGARNGQTTSQPQTQAQAYGLAGSPATSAGAGGITTSGGIPWLMIFGGAAVLVLLWKRA